MISPSLLALESLGRPVPSGTPSRYLLRCCMCGIDIHPGETVVAFSPDAGFTDLTSLSDPSSASICGPCLGVWNADFTQTYAKSVICREGMFPAAKNDHIAYWLLNPPTPPFLFFISDQQRQHLVWRTPVNYSQEVFQIRFGSKLLTIRRKKLLAAVEACNILSAAASDGSKGTVLNTPYLLMSRDLDHVKHGIIHPTVLSIVDEQPDLQMHIETINALTAGEIWALTAVLYSKNPHRPERVIEAPANKP